MEYKMTVCRPVDTKMDAFFESLTSRGWTIQNSQFIQAPSGMDLYIVWQRPAAIKDSDRETLSNHGIEYK